MSSPPSGPRVGSRQGLIALNVALLVLLAIVTVAPLARGQGAGQPGGARPRGAYSMVGGEITGGTPHAIYVVDANNNELIALRWNNSRRALEGIGYRDLEADARAQNQGGPR